MSEKQMTLGELIGWLDDNDVPYGIGDAGKLTVKGSLTEDFRDWVGACEYTNLPDELVCVEKSLWLEQTSITSLGNLASVGGSLFLDSTPLTSLGNLTFVGGGLYLYDTPLASLGNLTSVGENLHLRNTPLISLDGLPQVGKSLYLDQTHIRFLTERVFLKVEENIYYPDQAEDCWVPLFLNELETIITENERRESLHNTRGSDVDWDLYDR